MRSREFCAKAGVTSEQVRNLRRLGILPFEEDSPTGKWPRFSEIQLSKMALAVCVAEIGIPLAAACRIVRRDENLAKRLAEIAVEKPG